MTLKELFTNIANAIRSKTGSSATIKATDFATQISNIKLATGNATTSQVLSGYTFSNASGNGLTGAMTNRGTWTSTISPGGSVTIPAGYHNGSGKVSANTSTPTVTVLKHVTDQSSVTYTTTAGAYSYIIVAHSGWGTDNGGGGNSDCYIDGTRTWRIHHGDSCSRATCGGLNQTILSGSASHTIKLDINGSDIGGGIFIVGVK